VARLRTTTTDNSTVVLKTEMSAGHGGVSGRYEAWKETAYLYAWALDVAGAPHDLLPRPDATASPSEVVT